MLIEKPGHDPVEHTIDVLQILLEVLKDGRIAVQEHNQYPGLLLEDVRILFREYWTGISENKWDGFVSARIEVMNCIAQAHKRVFPGDVEKDIFLTIEGSIEYAASGDWDENLPEQERVIRFLSFTLEDLIKFQSIRGQHQHTA